MTQRGKTRGYQTLNCGEPCFELLSALSGERERSKEMFSDDNMHGFEWEDRRHLDLSKLCPGHISIKILFSPRLN